jgi:hypothetical protein
MMELKIFARNKSGAEVAALTMTVPMLDVNSVMSQFKVLVAPTDADNYEMAVQGLLTPHRKNTPVERVRDPETNLMVRSDGGANYPEVPAADAGEMLNEDTARAIAARFAPGKTRLPGTKWREDAKGAARNSLIDEAVQAGE